MYARFVGLVLFATLFSMSCRKEPGNTTKPDATPPATVRDLIVTNPPGGKAMLRWTAPGDDGNEGHAAQYDIRYAQEPLDAANWDSAQVVAPVRIPRSAGLPETLAIGNLPDTTWYFRLRTTDEVPNWSDLSNLASAAIRDTTPPARVTNLLGLRSGTNGITLTWTAPGDDGQTGRAQAYDLRRSLTPLTIENWPAAMPVPGLGAPKAAGKLESFSIGGLDPSASCYFALGTDRKTCEGKSVAHPGTARGSWRGNPREGPESGVLRSRHRVRCRRGGRVRRADPALRAAGHPGQ